MHRQRAQAGNCDQRRTGSERPGSDLRRDRDPTILPVVTAGASPADAGLGLKIFRGAGATRRKEFHGPRPSH
jgi:hypothetical protein